MLGCVTAPLSRATSIRDQLINETRTASSRRESIASHRAIMPRFVHGLFNNLRAADRRGAPAICRFAFGVWSTSIVAIA